MLNYLRSVASSTIAVSMAVASEKESSKILKPALDVFQASELKPVDVNYINSKEIKNLPSLSKEQFNTLDAAFTHLMNISYDPQTANEIDHWIFDIFRAALFDEQQTLAKHLESLKFAHPDNRQALLAMVYELVRLGSSAACNDLLLKEYPIKRKVIHDKFEMAKEADDASLYHFIRRGVKNPPSQSPPDYIVSLNVGSFMAMSYFSLVVGNCAIPSAMGYFGTVVGSCAIAALVALIAWRHYDRGCEFREIRRISEQFADRYIDNKQIDNAFKLLTSIQPSDQALSNAGHKALEQGKIGWAQYAAKAIKSKSVSDSLRAEIMKQSYFDEDA